MKPRLYFDTECYGNYWLFLAIDTAGEVYRFEAKDGAPLCLDDQCAILDLMRKSVCVSFNGANYDVPMITYALCGADTAQLKEMNDRIIVGRVPNWKHTRPEDDTPLPKMKIEHIDLYNICPSVSGRSLKMFAGRMHFNVLWDLPFEPGKHLDEEMMITVSKYCENDVRILVKLAERLEKAIEHRYALGKMYGISFLDKSDAQIAESIIKDKCCEAMKEREGLKGWSQYRILSRMPKVPDVYNFFYKGPDYLKFETDLMRNLLEEVRRTPLMSLRGSDTEARGVKFPKELCNMQFSFMGDSSCRPLTFKLGVGGLHSDESGNSYYSTDTCDVVDSDVVSYYPEMILRGGVSPVGLGDDFLCVYRSIKEDRVAAKKLSRDMSVTDAQRSEAKVRDAIGKIMINGTFGKTGSVFSSLYSPEIFMNTTLTGQLSLLMLIERLWLNGIDVVSANTDGIVTRIPKDLKGVSEDVFAGWERDTGLELEHSRYKSIHLRDVNNYVAVKEDGSLKRKGVYAELSLSKTPHCEVCVDAVCDYILKGKDISETVYGCKDIGKFVVLRQVNGGGYKIEGLVPKKTTKVSEMIPIIELHRWVKCGRMWTRGGEVLSSKEAYAQCFGTHKSVFLGKSVRWYFGSDSPGPIVYDEGSKTVPGSEGACVCMEFPGEFPSNINYHWYVKEAYEMLGDLGIRL